MALVICPSYRNAQRHRGKTFKSFVKSDDTFVAGIDRAVIQLNDDTWWIVPNDPQELRLAEDIGPFDTAELAWSTLMLLKD